MGFFGGNAPLAKTFQKANFQEKLAPKKPKTGPNTKTTIPYLIGVLLDWGKKIWGGFPLAPKILVFKEEKRTFGVFISPL